ncbi:formyltransferase family protein [Tritonibacter scottomollicae]|uniref:Methionyl-tRNA formyltransferase n=1 Tax=Tritonibacter scottomollicae TaxID=483013 RepID=A0A2T1AII4_TRISK|nr:formyltransferase family protein [Tritonibacter scottomollicae]PRZ48362.1 methionyl-tRNA formyltransferase [Tritonibacter scottomollicae]
MKVLLFGNKHLGALVLDMLLARGHEVTVVTADAQNACAVWASRLGVNTIVKANSMPLVGEDIPAGLDLIVSAHSHRVLPGWVTARAGRGSVGYHPSLLPRFKGRNAIADALAAGVPFTGGTVYHLTGELDGGAAVRARGRALQRAVQVIWGESAAQIWRRALLPLGVELLTAAVEEFEGA